MQSEDIERLIDSVKPDSVEAIEVIDYTDPEEPSIEESDEAIRQFLDAVGWTM